MKKHKSHARHVFTYLEKNYNIFLTQAEDEDKQGAVKKIVERKSMCIKNSK